MEFTAQEILSLPSCLEVLNEGSADSSITMARWDSREVLPHNLYCAFEGERVDGHDFVASALDKRAGMLALTHDIDPALMARARDLGVWVVRISAPQALFEDLARAWRAKIPAFIIALTGSLGKTSTKGLLRDVLAARYKVHATQANQNNELGVPATLLQCPQDADVLIVEMGMRGLGQIEHLCSYVRPHAALITTVGISHIELLGTQENIARAKAEICSHMDVQNKSFVLLNTQDGFASFIIDCAKLQEMPVELLGFAGALDGSPDENQAFRDIAYITHARRSPEGFLQGRLTLGGSSVECCVPLRGTHNYLNICAAALAAHRLGMSLEEIAQALEHVQGESGRLELKEIRFKKSSEDDALVEFSIINDAYNANPASMMSALDELELFTCQARRIAVLGGMGELGMCERKSHEELGRYLVEKSPDLVIVVGELAKIIAQSAQDAGFNKDAILFAQDASQAFDLLKSRVKSGDVILLKGSHSYGLEEIIRRFD